MSAPLLQAQRGAGMVEVLVTLVIIAIGLFGLLALQSRAQVAEMETYQRTQALVLLNDMASRIATNRAAAADYATGAADPLGVDAACDPGVVTPTRRESDWAEWCNALQGAAAVAGGAPSGAMVGGRGCVEDLGTGEYLVTVVWQGMAPTAAPPAGLACGEGLYDDPLGGACTDDRCRRAVSTIVRIADLE